MKVMNDSMNFRKKINGIEGPGLWISGSTEKPSFYSVRINTEEVWVRGWYLSKALFILHYACIAGEGIVICGFGLSLHMYPEKLGVVVCTGEERATVLLSDLKKIIN